MVKNLRTKNKTDSLNNQTLKRNLTTRPSLCVIASTQQQKMIQKQNKTKRKVKILSSIDLKQSKKKVKHPEQKKNRTKKESG